MVAGVVVLGSVTQSDAANGDAYSTSQEIGGTTLNGFTTVARRKLPVGTYAVTTTGVIRNDTTTSSAYVSCDLSSGAGVTSYVTSSEMVVPIALSPGVPGGGTWAITTTVEVSPSAPNGGGNLSVVCGNFGPAADGEVEAWFPNIVAIKVRKDFHKTEP